jgi:hypothetical protein
VHLGHKLTGPKEEEAEEPHGAVFLVKLLVFKKFSLRLAVARNNPPFQKLTPSPPSGF